VDITGVGYTAISRHDDRNTIVVAAINFRLYTWDWWWTRWIKRQIDMSFSNRARIRKLCYKSIYLTLPGVTNFMYFSAISTVTKMLIIMRMIIIM